jgi:hypothetical protein
MNKIILGQYKRSKWNESNAIYHGRNIFIYLLVFICYYFTHFVTCTKMLYDSSVVNCEICNYIVLQEPGFDP